MSLFKTSTGKLTAARRKGARRRHGERQKGTGCGNGKGVCGRGALERKRCRTISPGSCTQAAPIWRHTRGQCRALYGERQAASGDTQCNCSKAFRIGYDLAGCRTQDATSQKKHGNATARGTFFPDAA
eukprot:339548-Rhodomonas_salina.1